jgi:hypothetical protein
MRSVRSEVRQEAGSPVLAAANPRRMKQTTSRKRSGWLALACLLAPGIAGLACDRPEYTYSPDLPLSNGSGATFSSTGGTGPIVAGSATTGAASSTGGAACTLDRPLASPIFAKQAVSNQLPARAQLYLQLTDAEVVTLKQSRTLLPQPSAMPQSSPLTSLLVQLLATTSELRKPLIQELIKRFAVTRPSWPNPWALRLVEHPGSEHMNTVRVTLKDNAWIVRIVDGAPAIVDVNNAIVSISAAISEPERIAAIYYVLDERAPGAIASCETGKRELALGNESMVAEFALGTPDVTDRLDADLQALEGLFAVVRPCTVFDKGGMSFHSFTVCQSWRFFDTSTDYLAYQWALAYPLEAYKPTPQNLATLIQALKDDRTNTEPFVGTPQADGAGGAGGESGAGEGGLAPGGAAQGGSPF